MEGSDGIESYRQTKFSGYLRRISDWYYSKAQVTTVLVFLMLLGLWHFEV